MMILLLFVFNYIILFLVLISFSYFSFTLILIQSLFILSILSVFILFLIYLGDSFLVRVFYYNFILSEILVDIMVSLSFLICDSRFLFLFLLFKFNLFPFLYFKKLLSNFGFRFFLFRVLFFIYILTSKIISILLLFIIGIKLDDVLTTLSFSLIYLLLSDNKKEIDLIFNSLLLSNVTNILVVLIFSLENILFYILLSSILQFLILNSNKNNIYYISLIAFNGNQIFLFNMFKVFIYQCVLSYSIIICFIYILTSYFYIFYSVQLYSVNKPTDYMFFKMKLIQCFISFFISFNILIIFLLLISDISPILCFNIEYLQTPQYTSGLNSYSSYLTFLLIGENMCLTIAIITFMAYLLNFSMNVNKFPNLEGLSLNPSLLKKENKFYFKAPGIKIVKKSHRKSKGLIVTEETSTFNIVYMPECLYFIRIKLDYFVIFLLIGNLLFFINNFDFITLDSILFEFGNYFYKWATLLIAKQWEFSTYVLISNIKQVYMFNYLYKERSGFGINSLKRIIDSGVINRRSNKIFLSLISINSYLDISEYVIHEAENYQMRWHWYCLQLPSYPHGIFVFIGYHNWYKPNWPRVGLARMFSYIYYRIYTFYLRYEDSYNPYHRICKSLTLGKDGIYNQAIRDKEVAVLKYISNKWFKITGFVNSNMLLYCTSLDVIHSIFIKNLLIKIDLFYGKISIIPIGKYIEGYNIILENPYLELICFEYCGLYHHNMRSKYLVIGDLDLSFCSYIFS